MNIFETDALKRSRVMYIFEAMLEYLISILVAGTFFAALTKELGMSDSLTGILSSVISLGCLFQLLSVLYRPRKAKGFVIILSILNQLLFMLLFIIPLINGKKQIKISVFIVFIFLAYLIYYFAHPKKINWLMSVVDDSYRGRFTANKEIISLLCGMAFSYGMGALMDYYTALGKIRIAFIICAIVIFVLSLLHTVSMLLAVEKPLPQVAKKNIVTNIKEVISNKNVLHVTVVFVLYYISTYMATPFYGTYKIGELGLSLKIASILTIFGSMSRILVSKLWGRYADKKSFAAMIEKCFIVLAVGYLCIVLAVPSNGAVMFTLYYIFHGVAMGGVNSALINLVFDYVAPEKRADSLAICQAASGLVGFLATLAVSPLVTLIQKNGNKIFGLNIYAQQLLSFFSMLIVIGIVFYIRFVIMKKEKHNGK